MGKRLACNFQYSQNQAYNISSSLNRYWIFSCHNVHWDSSSLQTLTCNIWPTSSGPVALFFLLIYDRFLLSSILFLYHRFLFSVLMTKLIYVFISLLQHLLFFHNENSFRFWKHPDQNKVFCLAISFTFWTCWLCFCFF